ncbi:MAG TPA: T9SS type A sorting domain-containing protein [Cytophagaceae bacterium]|nr:T9SS type A sorting domain-containing protein [Cytophagaceae bacterium]
MKNIKSIIFVLCLMLLATVNYASTITVVNQNGDWTAPGTWDLNRIPQTGDIVNIPSNKTVLITSNVYNAVPKEPILQVNVYGVLKMSGGSGQLNLNCQSTVCVFGSGIIPSTGCNCNQIAMGVGQAAWKGADASITAGSCLTSCATLPVNLISFEATKENDTVKLSWVAGQEVNFDHYEVQKSADGIIFENIGTVNTLGSLISTSYNFTDLQPINSISYYRLKTVDLDQSTQYSGIISVNTFIESSIEIYPNPVSGDNFNVLIPASTSSEKITVIIKDLMGKEYFSLTYIQQEEILPLSSSSLLPGIYVVTVNIGNHTSSARVVIQ